jgi:hypothetical protein
MGAKELKDTHRRCLALGVSAARSIKVYAPPRVAFNTMSIQGEPAMCSSAPPSGKAQLPSAAQIRTLAVEREGRCMQRTARRLHHILSCISRPLALRIVAVIDAEKPFRAYITDMLLAEHPSRRTMSLEPDQH